MSKPPKIETYTILEPGSWPTTVQRNGPMSLEELQQLVGGDIIMIPSFHMGGKRCDAVCNEDGIRLGLPINRHWPSIRGTIVVGRID